VDSIAGFVSRNQSCRGTATRRPEPFYAVSGYSTGIVNVEGGAIDVLNIGNGGDQIHTAQKRFQSPCADLPSSFYLP
jgi:hypothetical protein